MPGYGTVPKPDDSKKVAFLPNQPKHFERRQNFLSRCDDLWGCRSTVELVSACFDSESLGVGTSPYVGDVANTGVLIPSSASTSQSDRYLVRFCAFEVPKGKASIIRGLRQYATIRQIVSDEQSGTFYIFERDIVTPNWRFLNGNISWHVRRAKNIQSNRHFMPLGGGPPGTAINSYGMDTARLISEDDFTSPLAKGIPAGASADFLGCWRDMRYPWQRTNWDLYVPVIGPATVAFYASVHQPKVSDRPTLPTLTPPAGGFVEPIVSGLVPEDQFLLQFPNAIYGRVAGAMMVDLFPCCKEFENEHVR